MTEALSRSGSAALADDLSRVREVINRVIVDKAEVVDLALSALLGGGHLLIEDLPGVGKTTLAQALALAIGGAWQRIQFTNDMLPADIVGLSIFRREEENFEFRPGPIFANVVLADEINRATPRTQSALLEAMAEGQVTVDGRTHRLPQPFFVIATQNPVDLVGTYPLPDSQLDRFLLRTAIGYPAPVEERRLLTETSRHDMLARLEPVLDPDRVLALMAAASNLHLSDAVLDYIQALVAATRQHSAVRVGLSPRATLALTRTARAHALINGHDFCLPDSVKAIFPALAAHRLQPLPESGNDSDAIIEEILATTPVP
ncbi:MAG: MoxR family ATPase [Wenzhouxiangella sp.]|jgi:MoxR-like ATPase|nr:MoxR family ATPase [Wenzhouxiangella sp.]